MATVQTILTLRERGWSNRRIGRELGIRRETVGRYVRQAIEDSNLAKASSVPAVAEQEHEVEDSKAAIKAPPGSECSKADTKAPIGVNGRVQSGH